jgi:hypothetical protein
LEVFMIMKKLFAVLLSSILIFSTGLIVGCEKQGGEAPPASQPKAGGYGAPKAGGYGAPSGGYGAPSGGYGATKKGY